MGSPAFLLMLVLSEPPSASCGYRICQEPAASAMRLRDVYKNDEEPKIEKLPIEAKERCSTTLLRPTQPL